MTDEEALKLLRKQTTREEAQRYFYEKYGGLVRWVARRHLKGRDQDVDDVFQNTFLKLCEKGHTIEKNVKAWLTTVAKNNAIAQARSIDRQKDEPSVEDSGRVYGTPHRHASRPWIGHRCHPFVSRWERDSYRGQGSLDQSVRSESKSRVERPARSQEAGYLARLFS